MAYLLAGGPEPGVKLEDICNLTLMCTSEEHSGFDWDLGEDRLPSFMAGVVQVFLRLS